MSSLVGKTILHYKILDKLGEGGMGVVYKAEDTKLQRIVATKFLPPNTEITEAEKERFKIEARAAAAMSHPNIATIYAIEEIQDELFIVMEYIEGRELSNVVGGYRDRFLPINQIIEIAIQIAEGLQEAHRLGIIHRDIKSSNIMITESGMVKIMDFGLAKISGSTDITKTGSTLGTVAYMSPEQAQGTKVDHRTDIWSLGVVLYEMLAGELPFQAEYAQAVIYLIINEEPEPFSKIHRAVPDPLAQIVHQALKKDSRDRYASCADLLSDLKALRETNASPGGVSIKELLRRPYLAIPLAALMLALIVLVFWGKKRNADAQWARQELLPQIEKLAGHIGWSGEGPNSWKAYRLILQAEQYIADDPLLNRLTETVSRKIKIYSNPTGVKIYVKPYADADSVWRYLGETPADSFRFPVGFSRIRLEKEGFHTVEDIAWVSDYVIDTLFYTLPKTGSLPQEMLLLPDSSNWYGITSVPAEVHLPGLDRLKGESIGDFLMDRYEVTNKEYKRFMDNGGYKNQAYWKYSFIKDGRTLSWEEAMALFRDKTGRQGPATWDVGNYPNGQADYPVSGISWYEAAAYAEFVGKSLPTIFHWDRAASIYTSPAVVPLSNISRDEGSMPVGQTTAMNRFGIYNLAGNVREWCFNESSRGGRFLMGGGWDDPTYAFTDIFAVSPFNRYETNGFRCIKYVGPEGHTGLKKIIPVAFRDFKSEKPVSDEVFTQYLKQFDYDKTKPNAVVEFREEYDDWILEKISFDAAYGNERMSAYLFLPKQGKPPYQTVIYFPGSYALYVPSGSLVNNVSMFGNDMFTKSGRAFLYPIYKSTYDRKDDYKSGYPSETVFYKEHVIMWVKDLSRSIDYLETRDEIDADRLAYYGFSWGGYFGAIFPAVEKRFKASVLYVAGLEFLRAVPEVEPVNYLPRIKTPTLMINGELDFFFPYTSSQRPFYDLLGTPEEDKELFVYPSGHIVPKDVLKKRTLDWLDKYLGPVE